MIRMLRGGFSLLVLMSSWPESWKCRCFNVPALLRWKKGLCQRGGGRQHRRQARLEFQGILVLRLGDVINQRHFRREALRTTHTRRQYLLPLTSLRSGSRALTLGKTGKINNPSVSSSSIPVYGPPLPNYEAIQLLKLAHVLNIREPAMPQRLLDI
jgi:hypothetical protein